MVKFGQIEEGDAPWRIAQGARRVTCPSGQVIDLTGRVVLARLCWRLALGSAADGDVIREVWREEPLLANGSGQQRLKTAIWALRRIGLRELIVRLDRRYCFDPEIEVVVAQKELSARETRP